MFCTVRRYCKAWCAVPEGQASILQYIIRILSYPHRFYWFICRVPTTKRPCTSRDEHVQNTAELSRKNNVKKRLSELHILRSSLCFGKRRCYRLKLWRLFGRRIVTVPKNIDSEFNKLITRAPLWCVRRLAVIFGGQDGVWFCYLLQWASWRKWMLRPLGGLLSRWALLSCLHYCPGACHSANGDSPNAKGDDSRASPFNLSDMFALLSSRFRDCSCYLSAVVHETILVCFFEDCCEFGPFSNIAVLVQNSYATDSSNIAQKGTEMIT